MAVLLLSPYPERIIDTIADLGDEVSVPMHDGPVLDTEAEFVVCYGHPHEPPPGVPAVYLRISENGVSICDNYGTVFAERAVVASHARLQGEVEILFAEVWPAIRAATERSLR